MVEYWWQFQDVWMVAKLPQNRSPGSKLSLYPPANLAPHLTMGSILGFIMSKMVFRKSHPALVAAQALRVGKEVQGSQWGKQRSLSRTQKSPREATAVLNSLWQYNDLTDWVWGSPAQWTSSHPLIKTPLLWWLVGGNPKPSQIDSKLSQMIAKIISLRTVSIPSLLVAWFMSYNYF